MSGLAGLPARLDGGVGEIDVRGNWSSPSSAFMIRRTTLKTVRSSALGSELGDLRVLSAGLPEAFVRRGERDLLLLQVFDALADLDLGLWCDRLYWIDLHNPIRK